MTKIMEDNGKNIAIKSHPGKLLKQHLEEVALLSETYMPKEELKRVSYILGALHDFGKCTSYFQRYIRGEKHVEHTHHALISAFLTYFTLKENNLDQYAVYGFLSVASHHTALHGVRRYEGIDILDMLTPSVSSNNWIDTLRKELNDINEQVKDLEKRTESYRFILDILNKRGIKLDFNKFFKWYNSGELLKSIGKDIYKASNNKDHNYTDLYLLYSALIDADKRSAGDFLKQIKRRYIPDDIVDKYVSQFRKEGHINKLRNELYSLVSNRLNELKDKKIFSLTAPTGLGKTLSVLNFAIKLRNELGGNRRIIYTLPFISIIEQNAEVFDKVLSNIPDYKENKSVYLIEHHHTAPVEYKENGEEKPIDESLSLIESWNSEIIVTTFVQLMNSIIANKNIFLKKFHNIYGSIIILDEVQGIRASLWNTVEKALEELADKADCRIILMTATRPDLLSSKCTEIVNKQFSLDRINVVLKYQVDSLKFAEQIIDKIEDDKSYLIIVNTKKTARNLFKKIQKEIKNRNIFFLSSGIIPIERRKRIKQLKQLLNNNKKPILVSTQVVEAGVDLDFDVVIRDEAPLDSIVQAGGRCNRSGLKSYKGNVFVYQIVNTDKNYKEYKDSEKVYGKVLINASEETLRYLKRKKQSISITESSFYSAVEYYFSRIRERIKQDNSYDKLKSLDFDALDFTLFEEKGERVSVFVAIDKNADKFIEEYSNKLFNVTPIERKKIYEKKKYMLHMYSVEVYKKYVPEPVNKLYVVRHKDLYKYYDVETGFKEYN